MFWFFSVFIFFCFFFFYGYGDHRDLHVLTHSFPTRRSSDLTMPLPQTLGIKAWQLEERAGCIFAWHEPEGGDPTYDLPLFQEWDDPRWIRWTIDELEEMDVHQLELA